MSDNPNTLPIRYADYTQFSGHQRVRHDTVDFIYVLNGQITISDSTCQELFKADSVRLLCPGSDYTIEGEKNNTVILLSLNAGFAEHHLGTFKTLVCDTVREPANNYSKIKQLISSITGTYLESKSENYLRIMGLLFQLLEELQKQNSFSSGTSDEIPAKYQHRIKDILDFIDQNYQNQLTLTDLAGEFSLTPQYLSKFFKKYLHTNFKQYLLDKRMFHARRDICYTDDSITEISIRCGFSDVSAFSRSFSQTYGDKPSAYRRKKQEERLEENADHYSYKPLAVAAEEASDVRLLSFAADTSHTSMWHHGCSTLMNIGYASNLLRDVFCRDLLKAADRLGIRNLRILGLISNAFIPRVLPDYDYYFLDIDKILSFLQRSKFVPLIELTRLPCLYTRENTTGSVSYIPRDSRYLNLLDAFLNHIVHAYPVSWLASWEFEIWKMPRETAYAYVQSFKNIQKLIRKYIPDARIGGPGYDSSHPLSDLEVLLREFQSQSVIPDFITAYFNLLSRVRTDYYMVSQEKSIFTERASSIKELLRQYELSSDFYATEWTSLPIVLPNTPVQASCYQASFVCKAALDLLPFCQKIGYWIFKDTHFSTNSVLTQNELHYFWGRALLNSESFAQPAYYAFMFLSRLGSSLILKNENFCITQSEENHFQVLTYQYSPIVFSSILENDEFSTFTKVYSCFENTSQKKIVFSLEHVLPGTYHITRMIIDRAHGSLLDLIIGSFESSNISPEEFKANLQMEAIHKPNYFKKGCIPEERSIYYQSDGTIELFLTLSPNIVCFWDVIRLI